MTAPHPSSEKPTVLVLAGSRSRHDSVAEAAGTTIKAYAEISGRPMIEHVVGTLLASRRFIHIEVCLAADDSISTACPQLSAWSGSGEIAVMEPAASPSASVRNVLGKFRGRTPLIVTTGDHPLLTTDMIDRFLEEFTASGADAAAAFTGTEAIHTRYPQTRRTALRFRDGDFTGCNLFAFAGSAGLPVLEFWSRLEQHRKKPLKIALFLGFSTLLHYFLGRLTLHDALARLGKKTGVQLRPILLDDPHAGIDVDRPADLELVRKIFRSRPPQQ